MSKLDTSSLCELGVQSQYLNGEGYLVDDALAGRLSAGPKFQIFRAVISSIAVLVVRRLPLGERTAQHLDQHLSMLVQLLPVGKIKPNVAGRVNVPFFGNGAASSSFVSAFPRAVNLRAVIVRVLAVLGLNAAPLFGFSTKLALKGARRSSDVAHAGQFTSSGTLYQALSVCNPLVVFSSPSEMTNSLVKSGG